MPTPIRRRTGSTCVPWAEHPLGVGQSRGEDQEGVAHLLLAGLIPVRHLEDARAARLLDLDRVLQGVDRSTSFGSLGSTSVRTAATT